MDDSGLVRRLESRCDLPRDRHDFGDGQALMPCGRCRQLLWENGGPECLLMTPEGVLPMTQVLPQAFGRSDLEARGG